MMARHSKLSELVILQVAQLWLSTTGSLGSRMSYADDAVPGQLDVALDGPPDSLFHKWRPIFHIIAPCKWMNDPCGPHYDAKTELYHILYQYNPYGSTWANMHWGYAVSTDMIHWRDGPKGKQSDSTAEKLASETDTGIALTPTETRASHDKLGVFSGGAIQDERGDWFLIYTGIKQLPTAWNLPYLASTETVLLAKPDGATWRSDAETVVIPCPDEDSSLSWGSLVVGWRDPLAVLPHETLRNEVFPDDNPDTRYITVANGLRGKTAGRTLLYRTAQSTSINMLRNWELLGPLFETEHDESWDRKRGWSGSFGHNFEMSGLVRLKTVDAGQARSLWGLYMGADGLDNPAQPKCPIVLGDIPHAPSGSFEGIKPRAVAIVDWGMAYAFNHFAAADGRVILIAWLPDGWITDSAFDASAIGYQSCLTLPREVFLHRTDRVTNPAAQIEFKSSWFYEKTADGSYDIYTLGVRPITELHLLRAGSHHTLIPQLKAQSSPLEYLLASPSQLSYEILAEVQFAPDAVNSIVEFAIRSSPTSGERTIIRYDLASETLSVDRSRTTVLSLGIRRKNVSSFTHTAKLRLWQVAGTRQHLNLRIFVDNSAAEIYANDTFALATRIYPVAEDAQEIYFNSFDGHAQLLRAELWDGLQKAWPERAR